MFRYFIVYNYVLSDGRKGTANTGIVIDKELNSIEIIRDIERNILEENEDYIEVVVIKYTMFSEYCIY